MNGQPTCESSRPMCEPAIPVRTILLTTKDLMMGTSEAMCVLARIEEKLFGFTGEGNELVKQKEGFNIDDGLVEAESNLRNIFDRLLKLESRIGGNA